MEFRFHHLIALIPFFGIMFAPFFFNRVKPYVWGMPFILFSIVAFVISTPIFMFIMYRLDIKANELLKLKETGDDE